MSVCVCVCVCVSVYILASNNNVAYCHTPTNISCRALDNAFHFQTYKQTSGFTKLPTEVRTDNTE